MTTSKTAHIEVPAEQRNSYVELVEKIRTRQRGLLMPLPIRDLWIDALLSERYTQARGFILTRVKSGAGATSGNCCLGVLGMEIGLTPEDGVVLPQGGTRLMHGDQPGSTNAFLEDDFALMLGLTEGTQRAFATANDDWKLPFPIIAKAIEEAL